MTKFKLQKKSLVRNFEKIWALLRTCVNTEFRDIARFVFK